MHYKVHQTENQQQFPLKFKNQLLKFIFFNHLVTVINDYIEKWSHTFTGPREGKFQFLICSINIVFKNSTEALILVYLLYKA